MKILNTILASSALVLAAGAVSAATENWTDNGTTCLISDISPEASDCVGFFDVTNDSTNVDVEKHGFVDVNLDEFGGTLGLFGETDWEFYDKFEGAGYDVNGSSADFTLSDLLNGLYGQIAIGFKQGAGDGGSEWAAYLYNNPFPEMGSYSLARFTNTGLSHMTIWGRGEPVVCEPGEPGCGDPGTVIPLPAAGWLLLGGLGGLAAVRRRKTA